MHSWFCPKLLWNQLAALETSLSWQYYISFSWDSAPSSRESRDGVLSGAIWGLLLAELLRKCSVLFLRNRWM